MKSCFVYFVFLISSYVFSQGQDSTLVRLQNELKLAATDSIKINTFLALAEIQYDRDFNISEQLVDDALLLIRSDVNNLNKQQLAKAYVIKGVINRREGKHPKALEFYIKAKEIYESEKDYWHISDVYHNMGMLYRHQDVHNKAITLYKKSIEIKYSIKDTHGIAAGYNMMGVSYRQTKRLDSALWCYTKAKSLFLAINSADDVQLVNNNLGVLYRETGSMNKALRLGYENVIYAKSNGRAYSLCTAYYNMSNIFKKTKEFGKSLTYADSSLLVAKKEKFRELIAKAYLRKSYINAKLGNYKRAYDNYRTFNRHSDSIFNIENVKKIQALELNHTFRQEKLADSLTFVQEKREVALLAEAEASKKWLYLALFVLAVLGGIVIGFLIRRNYKSHAQVLKEKLEKEQAQMSLLDIKIKASEEEIKHLIADNSMRLTFKEELLDRIKNEIAPEASDKVKQSIRSLTSELRQQIATEGKLSGLQSKIDQVNKGFDAKLRELYPSLTKAEREMCSLLRLNLSIKEIMTVKNSSIDAVKSTRYRIRKKLGLSGGEELESFIQNLS